MKTKYQRFLEKAAAFRQNVCALHAQGVKQVDIAKRLRVSRARINQIVKGAKVALR